ncbi:histidine kinase dimerization/phosphoacceptor domain -containing protein [Sphingomonas sp.]|uniref:sensor histidine kinase n=1 Tax=Sphingomonas sp. TaxID=28214 RepID=UPI00286D28D3|nr:histidine kinase dimerization/phosphoacceptor domain -containing protein [Sphingomonas sp.]
MPPLPPAIALTLVEAMVRSSTSPLVLLNGDLVVVTASDSFCAAFSLDSATIEGQSIFALGQGVWDLARLRSLLGAVAGGAATAPYELLFERAVSGGRRCLRVDAHSLDYDDPAVFRILMAVDDVTDARAATRHNEQLIADKLLLNRELQHRVANSLQIIASVLMQSAIRVGSDEARTHLHQAHNRVLSIAEVQRQLATTGEDSIALRPYLTRLCASIAASMIPDAAKLKLRVTVDESVVPSDISVSLGLIVTELVINALKHAFPDGRSGLIRVDYVGDGGGDTHASGEWTLEVGDNGVGMPPPGSPAATAGLGTSIVEALVRQRRARLTVTPAHPGTTITIRHEPAGGAGAEVLPLVRAV